jgi:hypothetical protein
MFSKPLRPLIAPHPRIRPLVNLKYPRPIDGDPGVPLFTRIAVRITDRAVARALPSGA